jgi:hypothetical protein
MLSTALHNQNIIGWHEFLRGFISKYWITTQDRTQTTPNKKQPPWKLKITSIILTLHKNIWDDRNTFVHGKTIDEAREKARAAISHQIREIYANPPKLAPRYQIITQLPLETRLRQSTRTLRDWLARNDHQKRVSHLLLSQKLPGQLTIKEAFQAAQIRLRNRNKFPPYRFWYKRNSSGGSRKSYVSIINGYYPNFWEH